MPACLRTLLKTGRADVRRRPFRQNPSQGDNPNIALTRPHNIEPLTLVARCMAVRRKRSTLCLKDAS